MPPQAMARLEQLRTAQGGELPPRLKSEIKRELHRLKLMVDMITSYSLPASWRTPLRVRLRKPYIEQFMTRFATESSYSLHRADWQVSAVSGIVGRPVERRHEVASGAAHHPDNFNIEMH
jgi:hypothetical protein